MTGEICQLNYGPKKNESAASLENYCALIKSATSWLHRDVGNATPDTHYINGTSLLPKTELKVTVNNNVISSIPSGALVTWPDNARLIENSGNVEFSSNVGGDFRFVIEHPRHFLLEIVVSV